VEAHSFLFLLFALVAGCFAVAVVVSGNIVRMAFYLIVSLGGVAGLFFLAGADFLGAMQLMIYVGGTLVLLVFGVMLTGQATFVNLKTGGGQWVLATVAGGALLALLLQAAFSVDDWTRAGQTRELEHLRQAQEQEPPKTATPLGLGLMGIRVDQLQEKDEAARSGMSGYLLVVLIGAAYLARAKRRVRSDERRTTNDER
jgi:NADH-quinone oxidoreductase subunit J